MRKKELQERIKFLEKQINIKEEKIQKLQSGEFDIEIAARCPQSETDCRFIMMKAFAQIALNMRPLVGFDSGMTLNVKDQADAMIKIYKCLFPNSNDNSDNTDNDGNNRG